MSANGERTVQESGVRDPAVPHIPRGASADGAAGERPGPASAPGGAPAAERVGRFDRSIVEGPVLRAVWKLAWPTVLHNIIGGVQGIVDQAMVGHFVGYAGNAAIGVSWQIFLVVVVFVSSLYAGMGVLVARFTGQGDADKVNRTVYQAFLTSLALTMILALLGYFLAPALLDLVNAAPEVKAEALPYIRVLFLFGYGTLFFFMMGGALRAAGDARTPLRYGIVVTVLNLVLNATLIPLMGTVGAAVGTVLATGSTGAWALTMLLRGRWVVGFPRGAGLRPDLNIIRSLFRFGLPAGIQGIAMNVAGVLLLRFIGSLQQSAAAQAAYAVVYAELFSLITFTSVGIMGATAAAVGQNLGAGRPDRAIQAVKVASRMGLAVAAIVGLLFLTIPRVLLGVFGMTDPVAADLGVQLMRYLTVSGFFVTVALSYTGGLQGSGDTRSPLYISIISQIVVPLGLCFAFQETRGLEPGDIWLAIVLGHLTRATLSVVRFRQGKWRQIVVDIEPART